MGIQASPTPNPQAMKFGVGVPVGGPATIRPGSDPVEPYLGDLIAIAGVASVFVTANFVTVTKLPSAEWDPIVAQVLPILEREFGG